MRYLASLVILTSVAFGYFVGQAQLPAAAQATPLTGAVTEPSTQAQGAAHPQDQIKLDQLDLTIAAQLMADFHPELKLPEIKLTMADVIDILADYNLRHEPSVFFGKRFYGVTDFDERTIHISDKYDLADRRDTILHEFVHVQLRKAGVFTGQSDEFFEAAVEKRAQEIYKTLFVTP